MEQAVMLIISLRGVNFGFWSRLGCFGQSANIYSTKVAFWGSPKIHRVT